MIVYLILINGDQLAIDTNSIEAFWVWPFYFTHKSKRDRTFSVVRTRTGKEFIVEDSVQAITSKIALTNDINNINNTNNTDEVPNASTS